MMRYWSGGREPSLEEPARQGPRSLGPQPLPLCLDYPSPDLRVSGYKSLHPPQMFPLGSHNALGSPDSATTGSLHPRAQAEEACLGTQLTLHEAVTSLAGQGKLREGGIPMATLSPAVVLVTSWPRSGHNHLPNSVLDTRVRTPGQPSSWHHFSCLCLKRKASGH